MLSPRIFIFYIFLLAFSFRSGAQQLILKNYKVKDGLPSSEVYCAFQDSKGFIWFGTDGGISRFDGSVFKNYTTEDGLADNVVFGIIEDKHGRLWFRSLLGKLSYLEDDSIHRVGANESISQQMKSSIMVSLFVDQGDTVWCGLRSNVGYFKIAPPYEAKDFKKIKLDAGPYLFELGDKDFICGSTNGYGEGVSGFGTNMKISKNVHLSKGKYLPYINLYRNKTQKYLVKKEDLDYSHVCYSKTGSGTFLASDGDNLFLMDQFTVHPLLDVTRTYHTGSVCLKNAGGYFWLGLMGKGVLKFSMPGNLSFKKSEQILDGFSVSDAMVDKEGGTWFTTLESGVYYSSPDHFISYNDLIEASVIKSGCISKIDEEHVAISNTPGLVDIITPDTILKNVDVNGDLRLRSVLEKNDRLFTLITTGNRFKQDDIMSYLWIKREQGIKKIIDIKGNKRRINFLAIDKRDTMAYMTDPYWVVKARSIKETVKEVIYLPERTLSVCQDNKGAMWLGCLSGLWSFDKGKFTYHGKENDLLQNTIEDIKAGTDGSLYFATRAAGVLAYKDGKYTKLTTANGLYSNNCKCLYVDEQNNIWVGSKNGLCKLKRSADGWQVLKFNLSGNELNNEIVRIEKTGKKLWLFTNSGLLSYRQNEQKKELPPPVYITEFSVNEFSHIKDSIHDFSHDQNYMKIAYVGLSFKSSGKLVYNYKLEGLDTAWRSTQNTFVQYPFLPPGDYTFYVKAISFNGVTSTVPAVVRFVIKKPFWQTRWFLSALLVLLGGATYLYIKYRVEAIRVKEEEKTGFNKQLAGLEIKALRAQMNPHFIFNAINSIQNYIIKNDSRTARNYLAKFAKLIRNVLENSKKEAISLTDELEALRLYVELEQMRTPGKFSFNLEVQLGLHLDTLLLPPMLLQPYVENAILHGLISPTKTGGQLDIKVEKKEGKLLCIVEDNGIGRKKAGEIKDKKQVTHRSMGLSVTEERIKIMNSLHHEDASICIEDKFDEIGNPAGTKVVVSIPLHI